MALCAIVARGVSLSNAAHASQMVATQGVSKRNPCWPGRTLVTGR